MKRIRLSTLMLLIVIAALCTAWIVEHRKMRIYEVVYLREQQKEIQAAKQATLMEPVFRALVEGMVAERKREAEAVRQGKKKPVYDGRK